MELIFEPEALEVIADKTIHRNTGARGLRSVLEELMTNIMFETPSDPTVEKVIVTKESVLQKGTPIKVIKNPDKKLLKPVVPQRSPSIRPKKESGSVS